MNQKNSDTSTHQDNAINQQANLIRKVDKIEIFAEHLLKSGLKGVTRWQELGTLKSTNIGTFPSTLRGLGINITKGKTYILMDIKSVLMTVHFIQCKREERGERPLTDDVLEHWVKPFVEAYGRPNDKELDGVMFAVGYLM